MKNSLLLFVISLSFFSCEKKVDFQLEKTQPKLTIEATIENGQAPIVILSNSIDYFSTISLQQLSGIFVHNAIVEISNQRQTHRLKEYAIPVGPGLFYYYYSTDSSSLSTAITGELNMAYTLNITSQNEQYSAATTIPNITKKIDSIWWKPTPNDTSNKKATVIMKATDPPGFGDYVRYWTKKNRESFLPGLNSVFDDLIIDGTTYELEVEPGFNRNKSWSDNEKESVFHKGDTVAVKLSNIDKATYDFWRTMEYTYQSVGNPFSTPTKVISNIKGNALGYFGGYASQYRQLVIPQ
ncbi:DUF4249 domain-containing protein [Flavisolibacter tropicus]|uniref:DUF4249 domain-containing protein n=1 Tax=Flavisolibacter tropicus TaxID=1492898 RepID=A0A172TR84_9BACT|nr:DUF4249 domain-containing protein [Flavisolibacter tropicus]ANE49317.1 hypothetical protein SY85_01175 [Flavisolibacter tropicus]